MIKKITSVAAIIMAISAIVGGISVSAVSTPGKYVDSSLNSGTLSSGHANLYTLTGYSRFTATNSNYNGRYKWVYAETYFVNNNGSVVYTMDANVNTGTSKTVKCYADRTAANNFLGIGQLGYTNISATGVQESAVVITRKDYNTLFIDESYYNDYLM